MFISSFHTFQGTKQIHAGHNKRCLELLHPERELVVNKCDEDNASQQWSFGHVNHTALRMWDQL